MFTQTLKSFNIIHILRNMGLGQDLKSIPIFIVPKLNEGMVKKKMKSSYYKKAEPVAFTKNQPPRHKIAQSLRNTHKK